MKILISAYACEPDNGSEPAAGWNWVCELSKKGHQLYVITRENNKSSIKSYLKKNKQINNIKFIYFDLPKFFIFLKKVTKLTIIYYILWQLYIYKKCKNLHSKYKFDLVHHITFCSLRHFSLLGELNLPTFLGPLGGAETSPFWLRRHIGLRGLITETFRDICNLIIHIDPLYLRALKKCDKIIFTTKSGIKYCPNKYKKKINICPVIGLNDFEYVNTKASIKNQKKILFSGRHLHWKGMKIGIEAFKDALEKDPEISLTIVGEGNATKYWKRLVDKYQINERVSWLPWLSGDDYKKVFYEHGIFIFPSLHDSGGFVILEALNHGLPVICFDLGGPSYSVNDSSGIIIKTGFKNYRLLRRNFSNAINHLTSDKENWEVLSIGAKKRAKEFLIKNVVDKVYGHVK